MEPFNLIVALLGLLIVVLGLVSKPLARGAAPPSLVALGIGVLLGPEVLGLVDLAALGEEAVLRERLARLTLGIALVAVALRVPKSFPWRSWRSTLVLVVAGMPLMWGASTFVVWILLGGPTGHPAALGGPLPFWLVALVGAVVTPTDPVAATPIVTGKVAERHLPERLRHLISLESGVNDGAAYLLVLLASLMLAHSAEEALGRWLVETWVLDVGGAIVLGLALGWGAGRLLERAEAADAIEEEWRLVLTVALALLAIGSGRLIGGDELLVAFAAGAAFVQVVTRDEQAIEDRGQEAVNRFFSIPVFTVVGLTVPWQGWADLGWRGPVLALGILLLRRPPVLLMLRPWLRLVHDRREALFLGWFGPIAVAALYYASLMEHRLGEPVVWHVVSLIICASAVAHGTTGAPLTRRMGERSNGAAAR